MDGEPVTPGEVEPSGPHGLGSRSRQRRAFTAAISMSIAAPLPLLLAGTLAVQLRNDIGLEARHIGIVSALFFLSSSFLSVIAGTFTDRVGWQLATRASCATSACAFVLVALFADGLWTFVPLFVIGSLNHAISGPAGNVAISTEMPVKRLGLLFGLKQSANPVANIIAGASVPLIGLTLGWRWAFAMGAVFPLVAIASTFGSARPEGVARRSVAGRRTLRGRRGGVEATETKVRLRPGPIAALALAGGFATFVAGALGAYVVLSAVDAGVNEGTAGLYVVLAALTGLTTRIVSGWLVDRSGGSGIRPVAALLIVGVAAHLALASGQMSLVLPATLLAYGAGWGWPGLMMYSIAHHYQSATGRVTGRIQAGMMFGGVVGPLLFALLQARWGYGAGWISVASASLLGAAFALLSAAMLRSGTTVRDEPSPARPSALPT